MMKSPYRIETIDLDAHADTCVMFRRNSYMVSFGTTEGLDEIMGPNNSRYLSHLTKYIGEIPEGNAHLWYDGRIIGQTEMKFIDDDKIGYVNLFFIAPEFRGKGLGGLLHRHACRVFAALGKSRIQLRVSQTNEVALSFYRKNGWRSIGPRPGPQPMWLMEFPLAPDISFTESDIGVCSLT